MVSMVFCHLANANSLREISNGLRCATGNLNHLVMTKGPSKSSLSYINKHRDCSSISKRLTSKTQKVFV
ncbi:hypothetical protein CMO93_01950 [Candidatus Woesearchaeota archaeon]|nr:hypothetical protein [Candidatus Woesearchaeota archaeon]MAE42509.1 hypothetical protein [Candidatus Woesearchaeota archaeon]MBT58144.1 hypothetical protein [Acidiferrobacteraceae bacterium]